jgi:signal peptidase I
MPFNCCAATRRLKPGIETRGRKIVEEFRSEPLPDPSNEKGAKGRQILIDVIETLVLSVVLFMGINALTARIRVDSYSMEPTLYRGDFVIVNKISYRLSQVGRGDVIVFHYPPNPQEQYIKRVIGLPGERVSISADRVYIDGEQLLEPYLSVTTQRGGEWVVPEDALFVLGDNRNNSSDSRSWGMVPFENVVGKAMLIYWPPEKWGTLGFPFAAAAEP